MGWFFGVKSASRFDAWLANGSKIGPFYVIEVVYHQSQDSHAETSPIAWLLLE